MFLLDNAVVREDWKTAKGLVTETVAKHGGRVHSARRFDERKLAYKIGGKNRATFLLAYFEIEGNALPAMARDFALSEKVLRHLILRADAVPQTERDLAEAENASGFEIPMPPPDDAVEAEPVAVLDAGPGLVPDSLVEDETGIGEEEASEATASGVIS
jgi:ribosomal protein S6